MQDPTDIDTTRDARDAEAALPITAILADARLRFIQRLARAETAEERIMLYELAKASAASVKEWPGLAEAAIIEADPALNITVGDVRYYIGPVKKTKARDPATSFTKLADALAGDFDAINRCLSSNAIKYGAARKELAEAGEAGVWDELFEVTEEPELKEGKPTGKSKRALQSVDERWLDKD